MKVGALPCWRVAPVLMAGIDNNAARVLPLLLDRKFHALHSTLRTAWAVFVVALGRRTPESMARLRVGLRSVMEEYRVFPAPDTAASPEAEATRRVLFQQEYAMLFQNVITSERIGTHLINMRWSVARFVKTKHSFLTSDRPFVMTNGIGHDNSHIAVPISPTTCFIAAATEAEERRLHSLSTADFMFQMNDRMAR